MRCASRNWCQLCSSSGSHLADHVAGLDVAQGLDKLAHCAIKIAFAVQVVAVQSVDLGDASLVEALAAREAQREREEVALVQDVELCRCRVFFEPCELVSVKRQTK